MVQRQLRLRPPPPLSRPTCTRLGLSWSGVVRTARSPGKPPIGVSDVMTSETLRSHETTQNPGPSWSTPDCRPVAPEVRAVHARRHHSDQARPPRRRDQATPAPGQPARPCVSDATTPEPVTSQETTQKPTTACWRRWPRDTQGRRRLGRPWPRLRRGASRPPPGTRRARC